MNWFWWAIIAVFAITGQILLFRRLQKSYSIPQYLFLVWMLSGLIMGLFTVPGNFASYTGRSLLILAFTGAAAWLGQIFVNMSLKRQSNAGFVDSLANTRLVVAYFISMALFDSPLEPLKVAAMGLVAVGVVITSIQDPKQAQPAQRGWIPLALASGVMFALFSTGNRLVSETGLGTLVAIPAWMVVTGGLNGVLLVREPEPLKIDQDVWVIALAIGLTILGNIALVSSYNSAPNLAYTFAVQGSRMVILYVAVIAMGQDTINLRRFGGVVTILVGVILLS
ncbi:MAG: hypothetical protein GYB68_00185 [Chloroflexi bacterium]|nr:hypothetical protein [Chloroflexota bacterium]